MFFLRSKRARRVTACTALALSAGMLLTGTASADTPAPRPSVKKVERSFTPPQLTHPKKDSARAGAAAAGTAAALPLSDLDGDFYDDIIFRSIDGELHSNASDDVFDLYRYDDVAKDIIPIGDQGGYDSHPEVLVLSENGTLTLYADAETTGTPYAYVVGGGWQVYNKIVSPGDVNNDGLADVVARTKDGQLYLYLATGDLERPLGGRILIGGGWGVYDQLVGAGDVTGDGQADLYARDTAGNLYFYSGTGNTSTPFSGSKRIGGGWGVYNQIVNFGEATLLARTNAGTFYTYYVEANGTLAAPQQHGNEGDGIGIAQLAAWRQQPSHGQGHRRRAGQQRHALRVLRHDQRATVPALRGQRPGRVRRHRLRQHVLVQLGQLLRHRRDLGLEQRPALDRHLPHRQRLGRLQRPRRPR